MDSTHQYAAQLEAMRPQLIRFALIQLRDPSRAEDAVQDALIAVLEKPAGFEGKSSLRTYVTAILKFKIIDAMRASRRECAWGAGTDDDEGGADIVDALFVADGHTVDMPRQWGSPDEALAQKDFFRVLEVCLEKLPPQTARIFMMREWLEFDTGEICRELAVTESNVWVVLYRARLRLRECLDLNWFGAQAR